MQILELCNVVNFGIDDDPLQHALVSKQKTSRDIDMGVLTRSPSLLC